MWKSKFHHMESSLIAESIIFSFSHQGPKTALYARVSKKHLILHTEKKYCMGHLEYDTKLVILFVTCLCSGMQGLNKYFFMFYNFFIKLFFLRASVFKMKAKICLQN